MVAVIKASADEHRHGREPASDAKSHGDRVVRRHPRRGDVADAHKNEDTHDLQHKADSQCMLRLYPVAEPAAAEGDNVAQRNAASRVQ